MKSKFVNSKFLPFFNFPAIISIFPPFFQFFPPFSNFPAFFGSSYHDVMNGWYEFNTTTTAHRGGMKVCTCMFLNITKSMVKTRKSHLERFFRYFSMVNSLTHDRPQFTIVWIQHYNNRTSWKVWKCIHVRFQTLENRWWRLERPITKVFPQ